ncbi:MAG: ABC transporter ATP-binding protein [Actinobacteria bacterium]|nr:ABC transporter ATP-binding protein [Actinomycetota bacterium]
MSDPGAAVTRQSAADAIATVAASDPEVRENVLTVEGLSREFRGRPVVQSFDLSLGAGDRVALHGPNGSGKTTILRCIMGTLCPTSGLISVRGHAAGTCEARALIGSVLPQDRAFYLRLTGEANLLFVARLRGYDGRAAVRLVRELEQELQLSETLSRRLDRCSTGMMQKLSFARALLGEPPLLLLDEPTRSLDDASLELLWAALERRPRAAVLIATHRRDDLARCGATIGLEAPSPEEQRGK